MKSEHYRYGESLLRKISHVRLRSKQYHRKREYHIFNLRRKMKCSHVNFPKKEARREAKARRLKRTSYHYKLKENTVRQARRKTLRNKSIEQLIEDFHYKVEKGSIYICSSCDQLFYNHSVICRYNILSLTNNHAANKCLHCQCEQQGMDLLCMLITF